MGLEAGFPERKGAWRGIQVRGSFLSLAFEFFTIAFISGEERGGLQAFLVSCNPQLGASHSPSRCWQHVEGGWWQAWGCNPCVAGVEDSTGQEVMAESRPTVSVSRG